MQCKLVQSENFIIAFLIEIILNPTLVLKLLRMDELLVRISDIRITNLQRDQKYLYLRLLMKELVELYILLRLKKNVLKK